LGDDIKKTEMGRPGSAIEKMLVQGFIKKKPVGRNDLKDPGVDGRMILK
jgi:hypothetical protein